jgi:hypothetical protein
VQLEFRVRGMARRHLALCNRGQKRLSPSPSKSGASEYSVAAALKRNIQNRSTFNHVRDNSALSVEERDMLAPSGLLRAGLALKMNQLKLATRATRADGDRVKGSLRARPEDKVMPAGLILMATLLGWAALRRRQQAWRMEAEA